MKTVRKNTFETNSSSCHSITFACGTYSKPYPESFELSYDGEFGWSGCCDTEEDKANYYLIAMILWINGDGTLTFEEKTDEIERRVNNLIECAKSHGVEMTLARELEFKEDDWDLVKGIGYIDHQSDPYGDIDCMTLATMDAEDVFNWIFDDLSEVRIDNDNH